ncbi:fungal specific transcription factor domain-containing protein [Colletotrichum paranaense]|uniref:Fungal specific transcription factor domain-containing protein n=1 Tax=Colletotrichum paranaense TaxID=1914294 RepID=A0ABQ9SJX2_9PEZI|nr:fungal specific transcription factor domain-containing protein [Colletotrichum paranaense]KAK1538194.1 fungal specific transcription factor domain-containing protein [Colletotrichum paranaense]
MDPDHVTPPAGPSTGGSNPSSTSNSSAPGPGPSSAYHSASASAAAAAKRSRVLLSCGPCRASKLKCDRSEPCGQCLKKSRPEGCVYAPKPEKQKPAKGMAARLKRLEGMVRTMMDEGGGVAGAGPGGPQTTGAAVDAVQEEEKGIAQPGGQLVQGGRASTYVGATHFMAILEDIEDMKSYFEEPETDYDESPEPSDEIEAPDLMLFSRNMPRSREDLLKLLPEQKIVDRLIMRYFSSRSPSQRKTPRLGSRDLHPMASESPISYPPSPSFIPLLPTILPTTPIQYARFWTDPSSTDLHWLALLFMVMSLGVFYSTFMAPHELSVDSPQPPMDRFKLFRAAAACCLVWGRYTHPTIATIPPFILYVEAEFIISRAAQMNCYVLSSVCLRLLLKMGLHRDPDRLLAAGTVISPYEGEMRRRMWNMAVQLDLLVSFHMGLPSMLNGIDADCSLPRNLIDEDFDEDTLVLPPARPATDYTEMTYPINKSAMMLVFGQVARQSHLLTPPPYAEVMRLDDLLNTSWCAVPQFMMVKPLQECVTTPPMQIIQRFGLASLYNKSRCVLHRRFLLDPAPRREHDYSRRQCLEGAVVLLDFQNTIWHACQPGNMLSQNGWFVSSLAVHDFLLAATILYLAIGHEPFWGGVDGKTGAATTTTTSPGWMAEMNPPPTRAYLLHLLQRSYSVWIAIARGVHEVRKTAGILETMLNKLGSPPNSPPENGGAKVSSASGLRQSDGPESAARSAQDDQQLLDGLSMNDSTSFPTATTNRFQPFEFVTSGLGPSEPGLDRGWAAVGNEEMDWRYFDNIMAQPHNDPVGLESLDASQPWFERTLGPDDFDFSTSGAWDPSLG